jgi:RNA polymerase sigma-70 factor (ECF subfamily)
VGEIDPFTALVRRHDEGLRGLAYRLLGDRDTMDDVLQETYVSAFKALPRFRGDSDLATWLYRIAYNACLDELRRRKTVVPLERVADRPDPAPGPAERTATAQILAQALAALAPEDRAAVLLVDAQGFDYAAAAEILGIPTGTVASRLNRARTLLRRVLHVPGEEGASA